MAWENIRHAPSALPLTQRFLEWVKNMVSDVQQKLGLNLSFSID